MNAHSAPHSTTAGDAPKLAPALPLDRARTNAALAGAVRELGSADAIRANGCNSLVRKIRALFPELMQLRGDHDAAVALRDRQVAELTPLLLSSPPDPVADRPAAQSGRKAHGHPLDEIAHRMWEISVTEQNIQSLHAQENTLRIEILSSVNPEHLPLVRWALAQA
jgi:hypothetical protein